MESLVTVETSVNQERGERGHSEPECSRGGSSRQGYQWDRVKLPSPWGGLKAAETSGERGRAGDGTVRGGPQVCLHQFLKPGT